jgi:ABC-type polysaccharide/polyol phosphate transport system ATPase subunit
MASIHLENIFLSYPIYGANARSLKSGIINFSTGGKLIKESKAVTVEALKNISLDLKSGDRLGLIGHNGAGKTSLLKVLAQIYAPTKGKISVFGRANCIFDVVTGMDFDASAYENIKIRGLILGLSKSEIARIVPDIEEFAELGEFMKMPIRTYSSGMVLRLAFGIVTSFRLEILLIDEILNVGDQRFMEKAKARMADVIHNSDVMVLSTHDLNSMREFCNKALWLEHGQIKVFGPIDEVLHQYQK